MQRLGESRSDDKSDYALPGYAPTYSMTKEDVALWSASAGVGVHTSRYAATGGDAAIRGIGARRRRTCRVLLRRWSPRWLLFLLQALRMCHTYHSEHASRARCKY